MNQGQNVRAFLKGIKSSFQKSFYFCFYFKWLIDLISRKTQLNFNKIKFHTILLFLQKKILNLTY